MINVLAFLNVLLGLFSFIPCLMAGGMSMDSPQAQESFWAHVICLMIMSFPLVCWICAGLSYYFKSWQIGLFPTVEAILFITMLWVFSNVRIS
jgi:heme/copper-type cytochrome/quinol oxidase subunit 2